MWTRLHFGCPEYSFFEATAAVSLVDWHDVVDVISMPDLFPRSARRFVSAETLLYEPYLVNRPQLDAKLLSSRSRAYLLEIHCEKPHVPPEDRQPLWRFQRTQVYGTRRLKCDAVIWL